MADRAAELKRRGQSDAADPSWSGSWQPTVDAQLGAPDGATRFREKKTPDGASGRAVGDEDEDDDDDDDRRGEMRRFE